MRNIPPSTLPCHRELELYFPEEQDCENVAPSEPSLVEKANVRAEDALDVIVDQLSRLGVGRDFCGNRMGPHNADVWVPDLAWRHWQALLPSGPLMDASRLTHDQLIPFYDAAWDLCRI
jgi:hypothetical protein